MGDLPPLFTKFGRQVVNLVRIPQSLALDTTLLMLQMGPIEINSVVRRRLGMSAWSKIWKCVVYLRPALRIVSWRSSVKNSRQEPTPSNAPQSMAAPPAQRLLRMRTRSFNKTGFDWLIDVYCHKTLDKSSLVQVMVWLRQATNHYLRLCSPKSMSPDSIIRPHWID